MHMSDTKEQKPDKGNILDFIKQYVLSPVDELAFSAYKVAQAVGLSKSLQRSTWRVSMGSLGQALKNVYGLTVTGMQHVPRSGPAMICTKNSSGAYPFLACVGIAETSERILYQSFDHEYFKIYGLRSWFQYLESISVRHGVLDDHARAFILKKLRDDGDLVGLTLENMRRDDGSMETIKNEAMISVASEAKVPIIPVAIPNVDNVLNIKSERYTFNQRISVSILPPFTGHLEGMNAGDCLAALEALVTGA